MMNEQIEVTDLKINFIVPESGIGIAPWRVGNEHRQKDNDHQQDASVDMEMGRS